MDSVIDRIVEIPGVTATESKVARWIGSGRPADRRRAKMPGHPQTATPLGGRPPRRSGALGVRNPLAGYHEARRGSSRPTGRCTVRPRITLITLGVDDLERSLRFYRDGARPSPLCPAKL
jgi:hypothetical protein